MVANTILLDILYWRVNKDVIRKALVEDFIIENADVD